MSQPLTGAPLDRADGRQKVTGAARTPAIVRPSGSPTDSSSPAPSRAGASLSIDTSAATAAPGVIAILTHENAPRINAAKKNPNDSTLFVLQNDVG